MQVGELLPALAVALGPAAYAPTFLQQHLGPLLKATRGSRPDSFRAIAVGACPGVLPEASAPVRAPSLSRGGAREMSAFMGSAARRARRAE